MIIFMLSVLWKNRDFYYMVFALGILKIYIPSMTPIINVVSIMILIFTSVKMFIEMIRKDKENWVGREIHITNTDGSKTVGHIKGWSDRETFWIKTTEDETEFISIKEENKRDHSRIKIF